MGHGIGYHSITSHFKERTEVVMAERTRGWEVSVHAERFGMW